MPKVKQQQSESDRQRLEVKCRMWICDSCTALAQLLARMGGFWSELYEGMEWDGRACSNSVDATWCARCLFQKGCCWWGVLEAEGGHFQAQRRFISILPPG